MSDRLRSKAWPTVGRLAVSTTLLWLVFRYVDADGVLGRLTELNPMWVVLGLVVSVLQVGLLAWRWRYTAARLGIDLPFREALNEYYLSILINQLLPGGVTGDVSRAWRHARTDAPSGAAVRAVILERMSAQVVMTLVAAGSLLLLPWASGAVRVTAVAAVGALAFALSKAVRKSESSSRAGRFWADTRRALLLRDALAFQSLSALLVVGSYIGVFVVAARAVGIVTPLVTVLPLVAPVLMTMLIPITVAGWGIREAAAAALWSVAGLTPEDGAAISVTYGLLVLASSLPGVLALTGALTGGRGRRARPPRA